MSTLTKIFIVLMVVFSIAFTVSIINFVGNTHDWRDLAEKYRTDAQNVETQMSNLAAAHVAEKTAWLDRSKEQVNLIGDLNKKHEENLDQIRQLRDRVAQLEADKTDANAAIRKLTSQLEVAQSGWMEQRDYAEALEKRNGDLSTRNVGLNERVNELTARIVVLVQTQNQLEQQINVLRKGDTRVAVAGDTSSIDGVSAVAAPASTPIRGKIVEVAGDVATISVGSADGVRKDTVFVIYRGSDYVGDLRVTDVEPNISAGKILSSRMSPRPQDSVADEPALGLGK